MATRKVILILTGEISTGKTTLTNFLEDKFSFKTLKTKELLKELAKEKFKGKEPSREELQKYGQYLDENEDGKWVLNGFQSKFSGIFDVENYFVIDAARILNQITHFREAYSISVVHIHLTAEAETLKERYLSRESQTGKATNIIESEYSNVKQDPTEKGVGDLAKEADLVINTELCNKSDILTRVVSFLRLLPSTHNELVDVIVGGQFGSEGKGQIAAYLAPEYDCLVRVGGPNAGHSVYESNGNHTFHSLPSGTMRNPKAKLILGPGTIINADKLLEEITKFGIEDANRLTIDENVTVIDVEDINYEKLRSQIGTTAQGVGHATAKNILERLEGKDNHKAKKIPEKLKPYLGSAHDELEKLYAEGKKIMLEGTQGTGLSLYHGIYPFVTSRDTTVSGCLSEAGISPKRVRKIVMVTRTYPIRVGGTSGPFISEEINWKVVAERSGIDFNLLEATEKTTTTQRDRRVAEFSWYLFRRACELNSPTDIALTFADYITKKNKSSRSYNQLSEQTQLFIEEIERASGVKVSLISIAFNYRAIIDRRNWK